MTDVTHTVRDIILLGSTGSIGTQTLDLVSRNPERFRIVGLAAGGGNPELLAEQALTTGARTVAVAKASAAQDLNLAFYAAAQKRGYSAGEFQIPEILAGPEASAELAARECDIVLNAIDGAAGLKATLVALDSGRTLALANKESLIIGGDLVARRAKPGQIVPVDSEHSALAQALRGGRAQEVDKLVVTASGGPFRGRTRAEMADASPEQAMKHPTWNMGPLVTCNSATLVNKGLEVIEAHLLFDVPFDRIEVVVHPQSIVHSMVQFVDGSTLAQASPPDMRLPIALALGWPDRVPGAAPALDWTKAATWEFFPLDDEAFPSVRLAKQVGATGGTAPAVFNGANEECVAAFLTGRLRFPAIVDTIERVVAEHAGSGRSQGGDLTLEAVLEADSWARTRARELTAG
ncbi:1-deoxy-D-xylulose-5-phosphate reductoisomerase [Catenulispora sp. GAS73]|uniref:1-deoxy-D-xylulose-5-phosphate reductoisomerase n=1 Tax=Catenulispora sp. GAS73 TaxID=3156269 RepID=UPI003511F6F7